MKREYGARKGEQVFYASRNKGTITGVEYSRRRRAKRNPLFSPTEEVVMVVLGTASLIGIAYYISVKNQPSGNTLAGT
jgi:hypothetical protein